jgi:hypothetical protein
MGAAFLAFDSPRRMLLMEGDHGPLPSGITRSWMVYKNRRITDPA